MHWLVESAEEKEAKRLLQIGVRGSIQIARQSNEALYC
jgi:hypothetical protein